MVGKWKTILQFYCVKFRLENALPDQILFLSLFLYINLVVTSPIYSSTLSL